MVVLSGRLCRRSRFNVKCFKVDSEGEENVPASYQKGGAPILWRFRRNEDGRKLQPECDGTCGGQSNAVEVLCRSAMSVAPGVEFQTESGGCNGCVGHLLEKC